MLKNLKFITTIRKDFKDDVDRNYAFEQFKLTNFYNANCDYIITYHYAAEDYDVFEIPKDDNKDLKQYIETLTTQSFDGWNEDEIAGYLTALASIEAKIY